MKLPMKLLLKRLENEEEELKTRGYKFSSDTYVNGESGRTIKLTTIHGEEVIEVVKRYRIIIHADGYEKVDSKIKERSSHEVYIYILRHYPLPSPTKLGAPVRFQWITPIYHPNISNGVEAGGLGVVCWNIIKEWIPSFTLPHIVEGLERLVESPNPDDALLYPECREAATWVREFLLR